MNDYYLSLPREMNIPQGWEKTPLPQDRVNQIAKSRLAHWSEEQLKSREKLVNVSTIPLIIGLGASLFWVLIPCAVFCGIGLMICLIGGAAIRNERTVRETTACRQTCLEIEDWLEQLNRFCEAINLLISEGQRKALTETDNAQHLQRLLNELPENKVKEFSEQIIQHHIKLFGEMRKIGERQYSYNWMDNPFLLTFGTHVTHLYIRLKTLNKHLADYQNQPNAENRESLILSAKWVYDFSLHNTACNQANPQAEAIDNAVDNDLREGVLGDNRPPQGPENFATLMDEAEYWRKNIAVFRSSL